MTPDERQTGARSNGKKNVHDTSLSKNDRLKGTGADRKRSLKRLGGGAWTTADRSNHFRSERKKKEKRSPCKTNSLGERAFGGKVSKKWKWKGKRKGENRRKSSRSGQRRRSPPSGTAKEFRGGQSKDPSRAIPETKSPKKKVI